MHALIPACILNLPRQLGRNLVFISNNSSVKVLFYILRNLLRLRYKVEISGIDLLRSNKTVVFLPNHQALSDPPLLLSYIYKYSAAVPAVTEGFYNLPILGFVFRKWGAVEVADLQTGSRQTDVLTKTVDALVHAVENGRNILLYPSGQISDGAFEKIKNKQSAREIVAQVSADTLILAVRISGLWGSSWSKYSTSKSPSFFSVLLKSIFWLFANLLIFMPRRKVVIEFADISMKAKELSQSGRQEFNQFLEAHYNGGLPEHATLVKHHFLQLKHKQPKLTESHVPLEISDSEIPVSILSKVAEVIQNELELTKPIALSDDLENDLGLDSLGLVSVIEQIEASLGHRFPQNIADVRTVKHLCILALGHNEVAMVYKPCPFADDSGNAGLLHINPDSTIVKESARILSENGNASLLWDNLLGSSAKKDILLKAYVVAELIKSKTTEKHIGIMLPAVQSTVVLILGTYLAGKIPVMLNWTVGKPNLLHCAKVSGLDTILSASGFYDKVAEKIPEQLSSAFVFLDKEVPNLTLKLKLRGALKKVLGMNINTCKPEDTAVILFTSGSESVPKPVPLTHRNILCDLNGVFRTVPVPAKEVFLSFLPPFHSFGFTVLNILPLVSGARVAYTPDPTNADEVLRVLAHTHANLLIGTPTFIRNIVHRATKEQLSTLRFVVSGAEAMPPALYEQAKAKTENCFILEGYGITECSPVLSINPLDVQKMNSVGVILPQVHALLAHPETMAILPTVGEGLLLVRGESVFSGYADATIADPFVMVDGQRYYNSGDIVRRDEDGYIFITGRLKRFLKSGGEMLSLPYLEALLNGEFGSEDASVLAVEGVETQAGAKITLFSTGSLTHEQANEFLKQNGVGNVYRMKETVTLDEIPMLGSGKIDYKALRKLCDDGE